MAFFVFLVIYCLLSVKHRKPETLKAGELDEALNYCKQDFENRIIEMKIDDLLTELPGNNLEC